MSELSMSNVDWGKYGSWLKRMVFWSIIIFIALQISSTVDPDSTRAATYQKLSNMIKDFYVTIFDFARPFVEIILLLLIVSWAIKRFEIKFEIPPIKDWQIYNVLILMIVGGFVFAALRGLNGATYLKDLALIVLGFYFGRGMKS
jgi:hypothetical protein